MHFVRSDTEGPKATRLSNPAAPITLLVAAVRLPQVTDVTTDNKDHKRGRSAILFPHTWLTGTESDRILAAFDDLTVCQPWYMDAPHHADAGDSRTHVVRPGDALMPPQDFMKILAEYRTWAGQNPGYAFFPTQREEDATWEIRASLRHEEKPVHSRVQEQALKWHLILHLERELEESRRAADEMLVRVKAERSPLAEALGEATPLQGLLDDLPVREPVAHTDGPRLKQVMRAWFGLFGPSLPHDGILVTKDREVLSHAEELFGADAVQLDETGKASSFPAVQLPISADTRRMERDPVYAGLSGKTLVLIDNA